MASYDFMADVIAGVRKQQMEQSAAQATQNQIAQNRARSGQRLGNLPGQTSPDDPVRLLQRWSQFAPTAPPGALLGAVKAGISADSDVGQWLVRQAVPALSQQSSNPQNYDKAMTLLTDPSFLDAAKNMSLSDSTKFLSNASLGNMQAPSPNSSDAIGNALAQHLNSAQGPDQASFGGVLGGVTGGIKTGLREAGVVMETGAQAISAGIKQQAGGLTQAVTDVSHGQLPTQTGHSTAGGVPLDEPSFTTPKWHLPGVADIPGLNSIPGIKQSPYLGGIAGGGSKFKFGTQQQLQDIPGQTTLGQQLRGESVGTGFFPGGTATEKANLAQKAAATVNGHALTPGRAFAAFVTEPDSVASDLASGLIDMQIAIHGDPANLVLNEFSDARKASKLFAPTTADALDQAAHSVVNRGIDNLQQVREWAGALPSNGQVPDLLEAVRAKIASDPGSLSQLADAGVNPRDVLKDIGAPTIGAFSGLRRYIHQPTALEWLYGSQGDAAVNTIRQAGFTDLRRYLGKDVPVDYLAQLAQSKDPQEIRSLLGQGLGTSVRSTPSAGFDFHYDPTARWSQFMPHGSVSHLELNNAIEQSERTLAEVKVPREKWDGILTKIASAQTKAQFDTAYLEGVGNAVSQQLVDGYGLSPKRARMLAKFYPQNHVSDGRFWTDEVANTPIVAGLALGGESIPLSGPTIGSELAQTIPTLNARDLKLSASKMGKIYATIDGVNYRADDASNMAKYYSSRAAQAIEYGASGYTKAFKVGVLSRLGLGVRINAEAQARMSIGGLSSMFSHPIDYIAWVLGHKGMVDINEKNFLDTLGDHSSTFLGSVGKTSYVNESGMFDTNAQIAKHWVPLRQSDGQYPSAWADKLSRLHLDMPSRLVAQAMEDPANFTAPGVEGHSGIDAVKEWFSNGAGQKYRQNLIDANLKDTNRQPWSVNLTNRLNADNYIDNVLVPQVMQHTAGDPDLLAAVAHAGPFGPKGIEDDLVGKLKEMADAGVGPKFVNGAAPVQKGRLKLFSNALGAFFSATVDLPYRTMAKSPTWRQFYWKEGTRLLPFMETGAQDQLIESAKAAGISLTKPATAGDLALAEAERLSNIRAGIDSHAMLHYIDERNNTMETLRYVLPFGDAFRNVVTQWTRLASENPQALRRVQQGVQEMRSSGFFYKDPKTGNEVFTMVPAAGVKALTGVDWKMTAPVKGLNLASQGLPGVGPALTLPASLLLPKNNPIADAVANQIMPYGPPNVGDGIVESLFPGWLDKLKIGGWLGPVGPSADQKVTLQDLAKQVFAQKASSGHYDLSDPNVKAQVSADSLDAAKRLYLLRGLVQFAAPSAPNYIPRVFADKKNAQLATGGYIETWKIANDYRTMLKATGDSYTATLQLVAKYGPNYIYGAQSMNQNQVYGVPVNTDGVAFAYEHPGAARNYPTVFGFFAPQGGAFDKTAYYQAIADGKIKALSVDEWSSIANQRLGNAVYANLRSRIGASPTTEQAQWLADNKAAIAKEFPGFGDESLKVSRKKLDGPGGTVDELRRAVKDPALSGRPLAHAAAVYLELRDRALAQARERTGKSTTTLAGNAMADLRDWLYQNGTIIATKIPDFTTMWNNLFQNEVAPPTDPTLGATVAATSGS